MSMFGTLLIVWGLVKEGLLGKPVNTDPMRSVYVYPTMLIAVLCAFSSVKYNFQKTAKKPPPRPIAKPLKSSKKSKLKWVRPNNNIWISKGLFRLAFNAVVTRYAKATKKYVSRYIVPQSLCITFFSPALLGWILWCWNWNGTKWLFSCISLSSFSL